MRLRRGLPLIIFVVVLIAVPILEVWLLLQVGHQIGLLPTILILVGEALLGGWLMRREGSRAWQALNTELATGRMPSGQLADAGLILVGGVLLMLPGFITDLIGLLFLIPWTRPMARSVIAFFVARRMNRLGLDVMHARMDRGNVVPGEVVDPDAKPSQPSSSDPSQVIISGEITEGPDRSPG